MTAALSIDFGNSYTQVGIRRTPNEVSQALRSEADLRYDEDNLCIPTVAARVVKNGKESWFYGTDVKLGSKGSSIQVFRNWKPRFFRGQETHLENGRIRVNGASKTPSVWDGFTNDQLRTLVSSGTLLPERQTEALIELYVRNRDAAPSEEDFDFEEMGKGYFAWLRRFVEPFCQLHGIGTTDEIPVRITLPSFGANSAQATLTLQSILCETGWKLADKRSALPEPVANLIGTFSGGRNFVWQPEKRPGSPMTYSLRAMIGESTLFKAIRSFAVGSGSSRPPIYWVMVADIGGYTTDFAVVGFDLDNVEIQTNGFHDGRKLLGDYSEPIGVHELDNQVREVLTEENRGAFDRLTAEADGRRINGFHREVYQNFRPYNTGQGFIGQSGTEKKRIEEVVRQFADRVAGYAEQFLLTEHYDHIDELILTGGGCNIPLVREAIRKKLERYSLKNSHVPVADVKDLPPGSQQLDRLLVRGATALGATSVFFDYD
jgi:hypothetical protein